MSVKRESEFDVVAVGASIAGCTAAIAFGRRGARVALVERQRDIAQTPTAEPARSDRARTLDRAAPRCLPARVAARKQPCEQEARTPSGFRGSSRKDFGGHHDADAIPRGDDRRHAPPDHRNAPGRGDGEPGVLHQYPLGENAENNDGFGSALY